MPVEIPAHQRVLRRSVRSDGGCLLFVGAKCPFGYGMIRVRRDGRWTVRRTHLVMWEHVNGKIPAGLVICHTCDVRECVEVEHLFMGTKRDNTQDMLSKGRGRWQKAS